MDQSFENYPRNLIILDKKGWHVIYCYGYITCTLITIWNQIIHIRMFTAQQTTVSNLIVYVTFIPQPDYHTLV